jgi:hygromycin-B 7''-O-kinase
MPSFPSFTSAETFGAWRANPSQWLPVAIDIAHAHGLPHADPELFSTGTNLVVALDRELILKIFPPMSRQQFVSERTSLRQLCGRLGIPIPQIVVEGEREDWPYLVITRLEGVLGTQAWPLLQETQKEIVLGQIGETIAEVQRVAVGDLQRIGHSWEAFVRSQIDGCRARHERLGLPQKYFAGLDDLLRDAMAIIPMRAPPVILTGEYIPENFLLIKTSNGWRLSGLFDFGDVMTGWGEYDLLGPSALMCDGVPGRVKSLLCGYGYSQADMNAALVRRLLALLLLHRASDPVRHIGIEGWQQRTNTLDELGSLLWPI